MDKTYDPKSFEERIYSEWLQEGCFKAGIDKNKKPYCIVIPPPNITGSLHMGHALNHTLQDILVRYKRMKGFSALWLPGTDHASIATEVKIVEKMRDEGLSKEGIGREAFLERAWAWKDKFGGRIIEQMKKLGNSCDWDRLAFTMDDTLSRAVKEVFVKYYNKGLIYKGKRIINWCPECRTALSDAEVSHEAEDGRLWHIKYPFVDGTGYITVATTRPETMLGDVAVAVNPGDKRYSVLIGKEVILPLTGRTIKIIADGFVDKTFGTGAVKITPAHDPNDFEAGARHGLEPLRIMDDCANITLQGAYFGMERYAARAKIVADLKAQNLLEKTVPHKHNVGHCYRCDDAVEPIISEQWFVKMDGLAASAAGIVRSGEVRFTPARFAKIYLHWMDNIRDWCISRQLWWGHRIPAYYCGKCGKMTVAADAPVKCGCGSEKFTQDPDVLDTWFSSALWPFSTLGYPGKTPELDYFFPTDVLVTAQDIIFFWVARMVFSSLEFMGKVPFRDVLINGLVRDGKGRKMSKSLGNGIDPLDIIDKYGADALRFSLVFGSGAGRDMRFSESKVESDRAFINKIWNAARYVLSASENTPPTANRQPPATTLNVADKWVLHKYNETVKKVIKNLDKFEAGGALKAVYDFAWSDFCDWYIEMTKPALHSGNAETKAATINVLGFILTGILKLLHPFVPFITEEIYSQFDEGKIIVSEFPVYKTDLRFAKEYREINSVLEVIRKIRAERAERKIPQTKRTNIYVNPLKNKKLLASALPYIEKLGMGASVELVTKKPNFEVITIIALGCEVYLPLGELIDKAKEAERLQKEIAAAESEFNRASGKLNNPGFTSKAPAALIEEEKRKAAEYKELLDKLRLELEKIV